MIKEVPSSTLRISAKVTKTKKKQHMLEEQIRDYIPCDVEPKEEENENI